MLRWNVDERMDGRGRDLLDTLAAPRRSEHQPATSALPRTCKRSLKDPEFLRAGADLLLRYSELSEGDRQVFGWLEQKDHLAPDNGQPHTYIYRSTAPSFKSLSQDGLATLVLASQGPPYPIPVCEGDGNMTAGMKIVVATTITDKTADAAGKMTRGTKRRGKSFRLALLTTDVPKLRKMTPDDFQYTTAYPFQLVHVGLDNSYATPGPVLAGIVSTSLAPIEAEIVEVQDLADFSSIEEEVEEFMRDPDEHVERRIDECRIDELEIAVYDDHEPRLQSIEARLASIWSGFLQEHQAFTSSALPELMRDGHEAAPSCFEELGVAVSNDHRARLHTLEANLAVIESSGGMGRPWGRQAGSSSADAASPPMLTIKSKLEDVLRHSGRPMDKLELCRCFKAQYGQDVRIKDINKALYELEREGSARKVDIEGIPKPPRWQLSEEGST